MLHDFKGKRFVVEFSSILNNKLYIGGENTALVIYEKDMIENFWSLKLD